MYQLNLFDAQGNKGGGQKRNAIFLLRFVFKRNRDQSVLCINNQRSAAIGWVGSPGAPPPGPACVKCVICNKKHDKRDS